VRYVIYIYDVSRLRVKVTDFRNSAEAKMRFHKKKLVSVTLSGVWRFVIMDLFIS
jgi:hypothetical protein